MDAIGDYLKQKERSECAEPFEYMCLRFDGRCFSKFTQNLHKPFDDNFQLAMKLTLKDTMEEFRPTVGYVQSDEISLVFAPLCTKERYFSLPENMRPVRNYNGRKDKIITLIASFISVRFNAIMGNIVLQNDYKNVTVGNLIFDGRMLIFSEEEDEGIYNYIRWRMTDCYRNCVSGHARSFFTTKELNGKSVDQRIKMMRDSGFDFNSVDESYKSGIFMKRRAYEIKGIDFRTGKPVTVNRSTIEERTINRDDIVKNERIFSKKHW